MTPMETVEAALDAYFAKRHDAFLELIDEDFEWQNMPRPENIVKGRDAMRYIVVEMNMGFPEPFEDGSHETLRAMQDGEFVMHERYDRWKLRGIEMGIFCCAIFRVVGGKIVLWRDYFDGATVSKLMEDAGVTAALPLSTM